MIGWMWWIFAGVIIAGVRVEGQAGRTDPTFVTGSGFDGPILTCAFEADGRIVAGGGYGHFNGVERPSLGVPKSRRFP